MHNPLQRLYRTKLTLLATWSTVVGIALLFLAHWASTTAAWSWLTFIPITEIGATLFASGLIVVAFTYVDKEDAEERATERFQKVLVESAPAIRDAVIQGFASNADALATVATPETLDNIVRNALAIQLGDRDLAEDVYRDLHEQVIRVPDRLHDVHISVDLSRWGGSTSIKAPMFVATVRWEYQVVPTNPVMRFSCVSDLDEYRELLHDPSSTTTWYFEPIHGLDGSSAEVFELVQFTIDGKPRPIRRSKRAGTQTFTVNIEHEAGQTTTPQQAVTVAYTYRVLVQQVGHVLYLDIAKPAKGLKVEFRYGNCGIRYVNVLDYIASAQQPRISRTPDSVPTPAIEVGFDGWVFPKAGVGFVWVLEKEMGAIKQRDRIAAGK